MDILIMLPMALAIELVMGEPPRPIHPVVWMGKVTSFLERGNSGQRRLAQFIYGAGMTLITIGLFTIPVYFILFYIGNLSFIAYLVVGAALLKSTFSMKELRRVALSVKGLLLSDKLDEARRELGSLANRDTQSLDKPLIVSATVESVAENACDSFVAPLFYYLLFGVPGAFAYRVVNTLDAMIGYRGKYEYLGKFAGKLDDVLNFIPARLTALLLVAANSLSGRSARASWRVALSEHAKTESPNAGWTMGVAAGALDVQLEKVGHYRLGQAGTPLVPGTIDASLKLALIAGLIWVLLCLAAGGIYFVFTPQT